jgi:predicted Zn-dependent protease
MTEKEVKLLRGLIARGLKDYAQAEGYFQTLHQDTPGDLQVTNQLALTLVEQGDKTKQSRALQLVEANARAYPNVPDALAMLGWGYYRLGRIDEAEPNVLSRRLLPTGQLRPRRPTT